MIVKPFQSNADMQHSEFVLKYIDQLTNKANWMPASDDRPLILEPWTMKNEIKQILNKKRCENKMKFQNLRTKLAKL